MSVDLQLEADGGSYFPLSHLNRWSAVSCWGSFHPRSTRREQQDWEMSPASAVGHQSCSALLQKAKQVQKSKIQCYFQKKQMFQLLINEPLWGAGISSFIFVFYYSISATLVLSVSNDCTINHGDAFYTFTCKYKWLIIGAINSITLL